MSIGVSKLKGKLGALAAMGREQGADNSADTNGKAADDTNGLSTVNETAKCPNTSEQKALQGNAQLLGLLKFFRPR